MSDFNPNQTPGAQPFYELRLTPERFAAFEAAGCPLSDPVAYDPPQTLEVFRAIDINNFSQHFYRYDDDPSLRKAGLANQYGGFRRPHFQRFIVLFPDFVAETSQIERQRLRLQKVCKVAPDISTYQAALTVYERFYERQCEQRLSFAWQVMSQLIDQGDQDYRDDVARYGEERAVWTLLSA